MDCYENMSRGSKEMASAMNLIASSQASYVNMMQRKLQEGSDFQLANAMIASDNNSDRDMGRSLMRKLCKMKIKHHLVRQQAVQQSTSQALPQQMN